MSTKQKEKRQPDLAYVGEDGKLHDDGLHDDMLASKAGEKASAKAARDAAIKSGLSKAEAERLYG
jgi:hypothetical protein